MDNRAKKFLETLRKDLSGVPNGSTLSIPHAQEALKDGISPEEAAKKLIPKQRDDDCR